MIGVKRELRVGIAVLLALQVVISFAAIGLVSRVPPAFDQVSRESARSIETAEGMLAGIARGEAGEPRDARFGEALADARAHTTEAGQRPILDRIERASRDYASGDASGYERAVAAVRELIAVNRSAIQDNGERASEPRVAGAWAAVLLAVLSFAVGLVVWFRIQRRIIEPLDEVFAVVEANDSGDPYRRCQLHRARGELRALMESLNDLLDERFPEGEPADPRRPAPGETSS